MRGCVAPGGIARQGLIVALLLAVPCGHAGILHALPSPSRPAAVLYYPLLEAAAGRETELRLANAASRPVDVLCFYVNANRHCSTTGAVCAAGADCCDGTGTCGLCLLGWRQTDFRVPLTPGQPIGWLAGRGRRTLPLDGVVRIGIDGSSNAGGRIPPVPELPFRGAMLCAAMDEDGRPFAGDVLLGEATILAGDASELDVASYAALGLRQTRQDGAGDRLVILGGPAAELEGCAGTVTFDHWFDGARPHPGGGDQVHSELVLLSCSADLARSQGGAAVLQFLVTNEFEQRFSTSRPMFGVFARPLSEIDTPDPLRSIFSVSVAGTAAGQTRLRAVGNGVLGLVRETWSGDVPRSDFFHAGGAGQRSLSDLLLFP